VDGSCVTLLPVGLWHSAPNIPLAHVSMLRILRAAAFEMRAIVEPRRVCAARAGRPSVPHRNKSPFDRLAQLLRPTDRAFYRSSGSWSQRDL
jgi:hypothetical protein